MLTYEHDIFSDEINFTQGEFVVNQNIIDLLFALLRSSICDYRLQETEKELLSEDLLQKIFVISKKHDVSHLFATGLDKNGLLESGNDKIGNDVIMAVYRYTHLSYEYDKVCDTLENANIPFIPLKGSVLRQWYPEPWMRTSCDIDILVHEGDVEKASSYLVDNLEYKREEKGSHDISLFSPGKMHIELHYDLVEDGVLNSSSNVLRTVWETAILHKNKKNQFEMSDEMFYFYHVAHMAKHFVNGGCGIRSFIDLWILDTLNDVDQDKRNELLQQGNLLQFAEIARQLSKVWFGNAEHTEITRQMEQYILLGGVYGTNENRVAVQQQKEGGRLKYAISRIFMSYDNLKFQYPILQKHRWLTPIMEVRRWFKLVFCGRIKNSVSELKHNNNISSTEAESMQAFLNNIGL